MLVPGLILKMKQAAAGRGHGLHTVNGTPKGVPVNWDGAAGNRMLAGDWAGTADRRPTLRHFGDKSHRDRRRGAESLFALSDEVSSGSQFSDISSGGAT
jgi:hypothetical protein